MPVKETHRAINWTFTWNNYSEEDVVQMSNFAENCVYLIFGYEKGENGTPHLQGFFRSNNRYRLTDLKKIFPKIHFEVARSPKAAADYCKKEGNFKEFGTFHQRSITHSIFTDFKNDIDDGKITSFEDVMDNHPQMAARYPKYVERWLRRINEKKPIVEKHTTLREWQSTLLEDLKGSVDKRKIIFIVDIKGAAGKSWFCDYVSDVMESVQIVCPGKKQDLAYEFKPGTKILFLDAPRSKQNEFIQYDFLEEIKNGRILSPKYESRMKFFEPPHVVVLMNQQPDYEKLSSDRYDVRMVESIHPARPFVPPSI